jgi:hypothetical protein
MGFHLSPSLSRSSSRSSSRFIFVPILIPIIVHTETFHRTRCSFHQQKIPRQGGLNLERAVARQRIVPLIHSHRFTEKPRRTLPRVRLRFFANR